MDTTSGVVDELAIAEASVWLSRMQGTLCESDLRAFQAWLATGDAHARAFAQVSDIWESIPGAMQSSAWAAAPNRTRSWVTARKPLWRRPRLLAAAAVCAASLVVAASVFHIFSPADHALPPVHRYTYQTLPGQQKTVVLPDNTSITLNTNTRIAVVYSRTERKVYMENGEALFDVQENPQRPFVTHAGGQRIVDLGTTFDVSHYSGNVVVTLLRGKVEVGSSKPKPGQRPGPTVLKPGERLTVHADGVQDIDWPNVEGVTAWRQGRIYFNDTSLADAVAELNRYGGVPIHLGDPALYSLRISGEFSTRDHGQFAAAIAVLHGLRVKSVGGEVVLER